MHSLIWLLLPVMLQLQAKPKLVVHWWTSQDLKAMAEAPVACGKMARRRDPFVVMLAVHPSGEIITRALSVDDRAGSLVFENVPPGVHALRVTAGGLLPIEREIRVEKLVQEEDLELRWPILYGTVTKKGKPVHARVFHSAVTDPETGRYVAPLSRKPDARTQVVEPCDGSMAYWFIPDEAPVEGAPFDIEIPANKLEVDVVDAATGQPVQDAMIQYSAPLEERGNAMHFAMTLGSTDERGRVTVEPLIVDRTVMICARHERYEHQCAERFKLGAVEEKRLRLALTRIHVREGRVNARSTGLATVTWHALDGPSETVRTNLEGEFTYKRPHAAGELVTVSSQHFFYAFVQPPLDEGAPFEIRVPLARVRTFEVHLAKTSDDGTFTLAIGDLIVPHFGLTQHMMRNGQDSVLRAGTGTMVINVLETAPISVIYAPAPFVLGRPVEWTMTAEARSLPRKALGEQSLVIVE